MPAGAETYILSEWIVIKERVKCDLPAWDVATVGKWYKPLATLTDPAAIEPLYRLVGPSMWRGYPDEPDPDYLAFGAADLSKRWFGVYFKRDGKTVAKVEFTRSDQGVFCWWFSNPEPFARSDGSYYGIHPCAVIEVPRNYIEQWLASVGAGE